MTRFLALDLSKRSAGWASWKEGEARPVHGAWKLGNELTPPGDAFRNLYQELSRLSMVMGEEDGRSAFEDVVYEEPLNLGPHGMPTTKDTIFLLIGLAATVDLWASAKCVRRLRCANQSSWRRHFLGRIPRGSRKDELGNKIKAPAVNLKALAEERCRELGFRPRTHDEAEALGILDYEISLSGITPPWRMETVLTAQLGGRA
jgi:hypothetical protein